MNISLRHLAVLVLAVNALFCGLMPHSVHCNALAMLSSMNCPPHSVHLIMGVIFYFLALFVAQQKYLMN